MSMFGSKTPPSGQAQSAAAGSVAIQAQGDVTFNSGLAVAEVRELCVLFLRDNFPKLREEARLAAEEHVRIFANQLEQRVAQNAHVLAAEKFRDPDVQGMINDAVQATARRGAAAKGDLLTDLIAERVSVGSAPFKDMVLAEAVHVVPKLTDSQVSFITHVHFVKSVRAPGAPLAALEKLATDVLRLISAGFGLSEPQRQHIQYAGACSYNSLMGMEEAGLYDEMQKSNPQIPIPSGVSFKETIEKAAPNWARIIQQFATGGLIQCNLTSVGQAVALANLRKVLPGLDYSIWLK